jgi:hypothetical protein
VEGHLGEAVHGLGQLALAEEQCERFDELADDVMAKIEAIRDFLLARERLTVSFTGSDGACETVRGTLNDWIGRMRDEGPREADTGFAPWARPPREGLAGPIQVAHCARILPAPHYSCADESLLRVGAHMVNLEYMIPEIRFKGNAYGAWCRYDSLRRTIALGSYEDPHVARTLAVFDGVADFVRQAPWSQTDVDRAVIATAKDDEKPIRPAAATDLALHRHLTGQTRERRERRHATLISAKAGEVKRAMLQALEEGLPKAGVCVVSSRQKLEEANEQLGEGALAIEDILR